MCGIAGAFRIGNAPITVSSLIKMACGIEKRGPHAWGISWIDNKGRIHAYKAQGRITTALGIIDRLRDFDPQAVIMHTRWVTHGSAEFNQNNHPHPSDGGWFVHNGQIPNWEELIIDHDLMPVTECDSEVLGLLAQSRDGSLIRRWRYSINQCDITRPLCVTGLWTRPNRAMFARRGNPLMRSAGASGNLYISTLRDGLPSRGKNKPKPVKPNRIYTVDLNTGQLSSESLTPFIDTGVKIAGSGSIMAEQTAQTRHHKNDIGVGDAVGTGWGKARRLYGQGGVSGITDAFDENEDADLQEIDLYA